MAAGYYKTTSPLFSPLTIQAQYIALVEQPLTGAATPIDCRCLDLSIYWQLQAPSTLIEITTPSSYLSLKHIYNLSEVDFICLISPFL